MLCRSLNSCKFCIESIHFSFECELFSRLSCRLHHCIRFGLNDSLLLGSRGSGVECGGECCNFSHSSGHAARVGNALLLSLNNCLSLFLDKNLLLCRSLSLSKFCVESVHFSLECGLLLGYSGSLILGSKQYSLFCFDYRLLFLSGLCRCKSCIECVYFVFESCLARFELGQALLLCIDNGLCFRINDCLLLSRSACAHHCGNESVHFVIKLRLCCVGSNGLNCLGSQHHLCFSLNNCLLLRSGCSSSKSGIECSDLIFDFREVIGLCNALSLCSYNGLLLLFGNCLLLFGSVCMEHQTIECVHFRSKLNLFSGSAGGLRRERLNHESCFILNQSLLLCSICGGKGSGKCTNLFHSGGSITGIGNTLLLCFYNGLLLLFKNDLLFCGRFGSEKFCIEGIHFSLKCNLFSRLACRLCYNGSEHCCFFGLNNSLLLLYGSCGSESSIECGNFCHNLSQALVSLGQALLFSLNNGLCFGFNNCILLSRSLSLCKLCIESIHLGFECKLFSTYGRLINRRLCHSSCFGLNDCLLLLCSVSRIQSCCKGCNFRHSSRDATRICNALLLSLNNCLLLLFNNNLLLSRNRSVQEGSIEGIHFSLECELLCGLGSSYCNCRLHHSGCFGLNESLLLLCSSSGIECSSECCNFCHSSSNTARVGNTLLLSLNDGINLLFYNDLLQFRSLCREKFCIESIHLCFECELLSGFSGRFNCNGSKHSNLFSLDNSLLLFGSGCSSESSIECGNFCHPLGCCLIRFCKTLFFSLNDGLNFGLDDSILLSRSLCRLHSGIESIHFSFECELFSRLSGGLYNNGLHHSLGFGLNNSLLLRSRGSSVESGGECCNFSHSGGDAARVGNTLLLRVNDSLCLLFDNYLLLLGSFSLSKLCIEGIHLSFECELFSRFSGRRCNCGLHHSLSFGLNNSLLLRSRGSSVESGGECCNFSHSGGDAARVGNTLLLRVNDSLCLLFDNYLLLLGSFSLSKLCIEGIHLSLECELFSRFSDRFCNFGLHDGLSFGLNDCLLLGNRGSSIESGSECSYFSHSGCHAAIGLSGFLLFRFNNCLCLLFYNDLLLLGSFSLSKLCIEGIHFSLKRNLFSGLSSRRFNNGLHHSLSFGLDDGLLLGSGGSSVESSGECCNFSHSGCHAAGVGNTLLFRLDNGLLLLLDYYLLLCRSLSGCEFCIESIHFGLKCDLFSRFTNGLSRRNLCNRFCHCFGFGNDDSLLLFNGLSSCKSGIECSNFCDCFFGLFFALGNALFLSFNDSLLLLFNNSLLLSRSLCCCKSIIELVHFGFELGLFCSSCSFNRCGLCHCLLFGNNNCLLLFGSFCICKGSVKCSNLGCESGIVGITAGNALFLSFNDDLLLLFNNGLLLVDCFCCGISSIEFIHFSR